MKIGASLLGISISIAKEKKDEKKNGKMKKAVAKLGQVLSESQHFDRKWSSIVVENYRQLLCTRPGNGCARAGLVKCFSAEFFQAT